MYVQTIFSDVMYYMFYGTLNLREKGYFHFIFNTDKISTKLSSIVLYIMSYIAEHNVNRCIKAVVRALKRSSGRILEIVKLLQPKQRLQYY